MDNWRDYILDHFPLPADRLTLAADPDSLLLDEDVIEILNKRGFEIVPFEEPVAFRYLYESQFRNEWDRGTSKSLIVVVNTSTASLDTLPYDLLQSGRQVSLSLVELFPALSYPVVAALPRAHLDTLFQAQKNTVSGRLGDGATKEFVLRHVFRVAPEFIRETADLLHLLIRHHYGGRPIPHTLQDHFIQILRRNRQFDEWPLEQIVPDRELFRIFLQERWEPFVHSIADGAPSMARESVARVDFAVDGPALLPFGHADVRIYIDSLFLDNILKPIAYDDAELLANSWAKVGVSVDPMEHDRRRIERLLDTLSGSIPAADARHTDWAHFAFKWAELLSSEFRDNIALSENYASRKVELTQQLDLSFSAWVQGRFAGLVNLPPNPPVMVHHIPRYLSRNIEHGKDHKIALIVVDGLSVDQWLTLRTTLIAQARSLRFEERGAFSWVPTVTSVSRQAIFAGKPPFYFPASIHSTHKEASLWTQYWMDHGFDSHQIAFAKGLGTGGLQAIVDLMERPHLRAIGLVVDTVDRIMHGMELGTAGMHNQIRQWADGRFLVDMISLLKDNGFSVYLTSDHGNVHAQGIGRPSEGAVAELRGERVRVYVDEMLRSRVAHRFSESVTWDPIGLPVDYLPLLAPARQSFVEKGSQIVSHGGIALEEVIVPFVEIRRIDR